MYKWLWKVEILTHCIFSSLLQFRLVGKTALKLLLVFVEYTESNSRVLYDAIQTVDSNQGMEKILGKTNSNRY